MSVPVALLVAVALLAATTLLGLVLRRREGRRRAARGTVASIRRTELTPAGLGARATLVQFGTEFCARCPQARRVVSSWAAGHDGVAHAEIDLTHRRDLAVRYGILSTPTTFLVDANGTIRSRFVGVPRSPELESALAALPVSPRLAHQGGTP